MAVLDIVKTFKERENETDILKAQWYIAVALAASSAGPEVPNLYLLAVEGLDLETEKLVQRRIKEAILKTSVLYGVPRSLQALLPLFAILKEEAIDHYGPRTEAIKSKVSEEVRAKKGKKYFDVIWTPDAAQANRDKNFKYQPDLYLLNLKFVYDYYFSEDDILSNIETQMCNTAALICSNCPVQAMWHTRGIVRHGGTKEQAHFAQELGLAIAAAYDCKTGTITPVDDIPWHEQTAH